MRRREFITLLGGAAAAWPLAAGAQQSRSPVIGYLGTSAPEPSAPLAAAFRKGLSEGGFNENRNVTILPELAADLVRRRVRLIFASPAVAVLAAKAATSTIPIIFYSGGDPVQLGTVASLNRPGGNITGISSMTSEITSKRFGLMHELLPKASRFGILVDPRTPIFEINVAEAQSVAANLGLQLTVFPTASSREIDAAFASMAEEHLEALIVVPSALFVGRRVQLITLASRYVIPTVHEVREFADGGGLMSYGPKLVDGFRQAGLYAARVLKGENPADLPVMRATKFEFVINLQTARAFGIEVPPTLLAIADEVIE